MKKSSKKLFTLSALILCGAFTLGGVASCGGGDEPGPDPKPIVPVDGQIAVKDEGETSLSLPSHLLLEARDATYFSPYVVTVGEDNSISPLSSGGDTLMVAGGKAALYAYNVPEGSKLTASVTTPMGAKSDAVILSADGTITAKASVTEKVDCVVTLYATDPTSSKLYAGDSGTITGQRVYKKSVNISVIPKEQLASNTIETYGTLDVRQRSEVTSQLEKYALKNGLTGVSISDNGGYAMYSDRLSAPLLDTDNYLAGYGFGTSMYGEITADLAKEETVAWKRYYHDQITPSSDPGSVNYLDSDLATVNDLYSYMAAGYWKTELNKTNDETVYGLNLARSKPIPLNMDKKTGLATKWKIPVWVGGASTDESKGVMKDLTFRTSSKSKFSKYNNTYIKLEDYLTPFKLLATQAVGWYRGAEQAGESTVNRQIKGFANYYNNSAEFTSLASDEEFSSSVGVSIDHSDNSITIEFNGGFTQDFAEYQLDSLWSNPISEEFVKEIGGGDVIKGSQYFGTNATTGGLKGLLDTSLSVGPYYLEDYVSKTRIVFSRNDKWFMTKDTAGRDIYKIQGYYIGVNSAMEQDSTAAFTAWENGYVDAATLIDEKWEQYENDPRKKSVLGDNQQKFTFNRMDKWLWDQNFGEGGAWQQAFNPKLESTWDVKPIASNDSFFYGLNLAVDREGFAEKFHRNPSIDYQNPIAKVNPVTGELYNKSPEHKAAMEYVYGDAFDDLSLTTDYAITYMRAGIVEELEAGHYDLGTGANPTVVSLGLGTIDDVYYRDRVAVIQQNWTDAFNAAVTSYRDENGKNPLVDENGKPRITFTLSCTYVNNETSQKDLITNGMWTGKYDIQYAYLISGNAYDTINNMDILMSDKMGGFELNFASDTRLPSGDIYYDGKYWSFNSLWSACNGGTVLDSNGMEVSSILQGVGQVGGKVTSKTVGTGEEATTFYSIPFVMDEVVSGFKTEVIIKPDDSDYGTDAPYYLSNDQKYYVNVLDSGVVDEAKGVYAVTVDDYAIFPGQAVGGPEGTSFAQFYITYRVVGENGNTAYLETAIGVLWNSTTGEILE